MEIHMRTYNNLRVEADTPVNLLPDTDDQTVQGRGLQRADFGGDLLALRELLRLGLDLANGRGPGIVFFELVRRRVTGRATQPETASLLPALGGWLRVRQVVARRRTAGALGAGEGEGAAIAAGVASGG